MPVYSPFATDHARKVVESRHPEFREHLQIWRWLQDSLEGGERYRDASYGEERFTARWTETVKGEEVQRLYHHTIPRRNLFRHPQEYPRAGDPVGQLYDAGDYIASTGDEYEFRRALTPIPSFVAESVGAHLARIYAREVKREAPEGPSGDGLRAWWKDVDGSGTSIDEWMAETIAPLFLVLGQIDMAFDHPPAPDGEEARTRADVARLGLDRCVASYVLPENLVHWSLTRARSYGRCVVREWRHGKPCYREWTADGSTLYDEDGEEMESSPHAFGMVPVARCFDVRKPRCNNVGQSRYQSIAELQRAYYNVDSELTLANSLAAHPLLSGPTEYCAGDAIKVGPGSVLPKYRNSATGGYEGWEYVSAPSDASERLESKLQSYREQADRAACLTKPAGSQGTSGGTVSQSGISKMMDAVGGNDLLSKIGKSLERLERKAVSMALTVLNDRPCTPEELAKVTIRYPTEFDLFTAGDFASLVAEWQSMTANAGPETPIATAYQLKSYVRLMMPGMDDRAYGEIDAEIDRYVDGLGERAERRAEMSAAMIEARPEPTEPDGDETPPEDEPDESD